MLAVRASEEETSDAFGKCVISVSAYIPSFRMPSCKQHDRQIFVETTQMSPSTTILCFRNSEWQEPTFDKTLFHGFLLKETDIMFSHGTFATATIINHFLAAWENSRTV